jgi:ABC-type nickel/cobalt efflux system permease component RcnA
MPDDSITATLLLGFLLGLKHALDADHVAAVAAVMGRGDDGAGPDGGRAARAASSPPAGPSGATPSGDGAALRGALRRPLLTGLLWGAGHAAMLLCAGGLVLALRARIPGRLEQAFEMAVALMLIALGAGALAAALRGRVHVHEHDHDGVRHAHLHFHARPHPRPGEAAPRPAGGERADTQPAGPDRRPEHLHPHPLRAALRPLLVGGLHGLAGSAGLALLALATLPTALFGCLYLGLFGAGSMIGMAALSLALGAPLLLARRRSALLHRALRAAAGVASLAVGLGMAWEIGVAGILLR